MFQFKTSVCGWGRELWGQLPDFYLESIWCWNIQKQMESPVLNYLWLSCPRVSYYTKWMGWHFRVVWASKLRDLCFSAQCLKGNLRNLDALNCSTEGFFPLPFSVSVSFSSCVISFVIISLKVRCSPCCCSFLDDHLGERGPVGMACSYFTGCEAWDVVFISVQSPGLPAVVFVSIPGSFFGPQDF